MHYSRKKVNKKGAMTLLQRIGGVIISLSMSFKWIDH